MNYTFFTFFCFRGGSGVSIREVLIQSTFRTCGTTTRRTWTKWRFVRVGRWPVVFVITKSSRWSNKGKPVVYWPTKYQMKAKMRHAQSSYHLWAKLVVSLVSKNCVKETRVVSFSTCILYCVWCLLAILKDVSSVCELSIQSTAFTFRLCIQAKTSTNE